MALSGKHVKGIENSLNDGYIAPQPYLDDVFRPTTVTRSMNTALRSAYYRNQEIDREAAVFEATQQSLQWAYDAKFDVDTDVGAIVKPGLDNLRGYKWVMRQEDGVRNIEFSQDDYAFDRAIVKKCGVEDSEKSKIAAFNPDHPHYQDFAPLRRNIALLRNYLMTEMFEDGQFIDDPHSKEGKEDLARLRMLGEMADRLGEALSGEREGEPSFVKRWSHTMGNLLTGQELSTPYKNEFMEKASIPDKGAAFMYDYLMGLKEERSFKELLGTETPHDWPLKPREETPLSDENLRLYSRSSMMMGVVLAFEQGVMTPLRSPETIGSILDIPAPENLNQRDREISVEYAREILEKLRKLHANKDEQEKLSQFTDEGHEEARKLLRVGIGLRDAVAQITDADPDAVFGNAAFAKAFDALEQLNYRMKLEAQKMLMQEYEPMAAKRLQKDIDETPDRYKTNASTESLYEDVGAGLKEAQRIQQQAQVAQRIAERAARRAAKLAARRQQEGMSVSARSMRSGDEAMRKALKNLGGGSMRGGDTMAGARVSAASQAGADYTTRLQREEDERLAGLSSPTPNGQSR